MSSSKIHLGPKSPALDDMSRLILNPNEFLKKTFTKVRLQIFLYIKFMDSLYLEMDDLEHQKSTLRH